MFGTVHTVYLVAALCCPHFCCKLLCRPRREQCLDQVTSSTCTIQRHCVPEPVHRLHVSAQQLTDCPPLCAGSRDALVIRGDLHVRGAVSGKCSRGGATTASTTGGCFRVTRSVELRSPASHTGRSRRNWFHHAALPHMQFAIISIVFTHGTKPAWCHEMLD